MITTFFLVFPNVPPAPGMPCQGEDRKFLNKKYSIQINILLN